MTCGGAVEAFSERASHARPKIKTNLAVKYVNRNSKDVRGASEQHAPPRALGSSVSKYGSKYSDDDVRIVHVIYV